MYQTEWQGIAFSSFARLSSTALAGPEFYDAFYREVFGRYAGWEELPADWRAEKEKCARFLADRIGRQTVLSVGCGLGVIESNLRRLAPDADLYIHDVAPTAWGWIKNEFAEDHRFLGWLPECLPGNLSFDLIYLSAVDYVLDDPTLISLLSGVRTRLRPGGSCLSISASFEVAPRSATDVAIQGLRRLKQGVMSILDRSGLHDRGQFWGWTRSAGEYRQVMSSAGFSGLTDGLIDPSNPVSYWIAGSNAPASAGHLANPKPTIE